MRRGRRERGARSKCPLRVLADQQVAGEGRQDAFDLPGYVAVDGPGGGPASYGQAVPERGGSLALAGSGVILEGAGIPEPWYIVEGFSSGFLFANLH
ncbi:hypothetical protein NDU88_001428 [Pleurodeles waltl]|uniref:Uncharacterized protein n=1 Tax=Pleurodeles waltl TaxID=8319 RepID=A0AAV7U703_PLEWA|nr:hypothetical protein NDU88_001428 [Pleurodeles waltl]